MTPLSQATVLGDVLRGHSRLGPAKVAVETLDGRSVTFAQLNSRVNSLVASVSTVGISKGARVAILARNKPVELNAVDHRVGLAHREGGVKGLDDVGTGQERLDALGGRRCVGVRVGWVRRRHIGHVDHGLALER